VSRWLILQADYGQLGNRLHTHANALAWCIEHKVNLLNLSFLSSSSLFFQQETIPIHLWFSSRTFLNRIFLKTKKESFVYRLARSDKYLSPLRHWVKVVTKPDDEFLTEQDLNRCFNENQSKPIILTRAWDLRCPQSLTSNQNQVREMLSPQASVQKLAEGHIAKLRKTFKIVFGVHARRGDYRQFLGGIHFHEWSQYKQWMIQIQRLFEQKEGKRVGFLLCSDEHPPVDAFTELPVTSFRETEPIVDLHSLSLCDYNIGPPSSFGTWLSFHGRVPRLNVTANTEISSLSQFSHCELC
jgi:hypothetical protein